MFDVIREFTYAGGKTGKYCSLPELEKLGIGPVSKLPVSIRIVLESVLRNCDGMRVADSDVKTLANWAATGERTAEIPFVVARVVLQDFTGVPLLVDLAAMRDAAAKLGKNPKIIEPLVPVDLVVDHSVQVDVSESADALQKNMEIEFARNEQRYQFLKWGMQAFETFSVVPPGIGIVHQVNLEYLAKGVLVDGEGVFYPDTLVGTDSHTTMINGLGIVGWGVGGIEAEAGMLGQPVYFLTPDVVGVTLTGSLNPGVTATDLVLTLTELLRAAKVVGKFVEFHGEGAASLSLTDRATIANMAPEYGATMGFFPVDEESCRYLTNTGRTEEQVDAFRQYFKAQGLFGMPAAGALEYSQLLTLDLSTVVPSVAGPKRPQDRIALTDVKEKFGELVAENTKYTILPMAGSPASDRKLEMESLSNGDVVIAAITSCTNTSNPSVMLAAGLVAKKAVEKGLTVRETVKTSLGPGSRVVTDYLNKTGLQSYLDTLGFQTVGYGCTTCIGNSGPLDAAIEKTIVENNLTVAAVLSGNRNFEARVHQNVKANFLMSPPLVVAYALAGSVSIDLTTAPIGTGSDGNSVYLKDIWPTPAEVAALIGSAEDPAVFQTLYSGFAEQNPLWQEISSSTGDLYAWDENSTYIQHPPYFENFGPDAGVAADVLGARPLAILGDSVTTDHISPAGAIKASSPAGRYLVEHGVEAADFNSYGSRRGNDRVMVRGTFANVRIKNQMVPGVEGGITKINGAGEPVAIYDAAMEYKAAGVPLVILAGQEYGTGSSRDWAAKGTALQGVKAVIAQSFERIHRSNLVGMGVLPCQFPEGVSAATLGLDGTETFDLTGVAGGITPRMGLTLTITKADGTKIEQPVTLRIDTPIEVEYYLHGGILPYVLRQLVARA
ncbi:aconitate hydratase AcnA [Armatimonas rosea]|uniref:Aconitate hydratase n=1 Tax=Armatimonas rosea TaxID=685828 RepID=A0A7W9SV53_ARMRO|nr:aconitate hydratase AcnA [Armatimonas rosea]MBB6053411.1 aconitate hydratase [Armatimonas rosea]